MKVRYLGPHDEVELPGGLTVKRNHQIDVPDELAGHSPDARLAVAMGELHDAIESHDHPGAIALRKEISELDYGSGLLAQDTFETVAGAGKKKDEVTA